MERLVGLMDHQDSVEIVSAPEAISNLAANFLESVFAGIDADQPGSATLGLAGLAR